MCVVKAPFRDRKMAHARSPYAGPSDSKLAAVRHGKGVSQGSVTSALVASPPLSCFRSRDGGNLTHSLVDISLASPDSKYRSGNPRVQRRPFAPRLLVRRSLRSQRSQSRARVNRISPSRESPIPRSSVCDVLTRVLFSDTFLAPSERPLREMHGR